MLPDDPRRRCRQPQPSRAANTKASHTIRRRSAAPRMEAPSRPKNFRLTTCGLEALAPTPAEQSRRPESLAHHTCPGSPAKRTPDSNSRHRPAEGSPKTATCMPCMHGVAVSGVAKLGQWALYFFFLRTGFLDGSAGQASTLSGFSFRSGIYLSPRTHTGE